MENNSSLHNYKQKYPFLDIVYIMNGDEKVHYIAKQDVPRNTKITDTRYWQPVDITGNDLDYANIRNKPTINGVEVSGEMTSEDLGVYSKPDNGIPESDLAPEIQIQLNKHFKGWYDSSSNLPANPVVGDYAYVKGTTSNDPATIYECATAGTWSDSNRTVDTSSVQTFATGEQVNDVHIVDDLITGGSNDVLSAEQGKVLNENNALNLIQGSFDGNNMTFIEAGYIYGIKPGKYYRVIIKNPNAPVTNLINSIYTRFGVYSNYQGVETTLLKIDCTHLSQPLADYYDFIVPDNTDYIRVGGRLNAGSTLSFTIEDIDYAIEKSSSVNDYLAGYWFPPSPKTIDGNPVKKDGYIVTDYIKLSKDCELDWHYLYVGVPSGNGFRLCVYDSDKNYIDFYTARYDMPTYRIINDLSTITGATDILYIRATFAIEYAREAYIKADGQYVWKYRGFLERNNDFDEKRLTVGTFNSSYNEISVDTIREQYCKLFEGKETVESFLFFTDPHLSPASRYETMTESIRDKHISLVQKVYNSLPIDNCICGGDLLNYHDSNAEALSELGYFDAYMRKLFKNYHPVFGNHDFAPYSTVHGLRVGLNNTDIRNIWFRDEKETYYSFEGLHTKFYILNSGPSYVKDMTTTTSTYAPSITNLRWEQVHWFANSLLSDNPQYGVVISHMYSNGTPLTWNEEHSEAFSDGYFPFAKHIREVAIAYNNRETITKNGYTYDFSNATGKILFYLCGHSHFDFVDTTMELPVVCTTNLEGGVWNPSRQDCDYNLVTTFDNMLIDFTNQKLYAVRVGSGKSRIVNFDTKILQIGQTLSLTTELSDSVVWESLDSTKASVSNGTVSGIDSGNVGIKVSNDTTEEYWLIEIS